MWTDGNFKQVTGEGSERLILLRLVRGPRFLFIAQGRMAHNFKATGAYSLRIRTTEEYVTKVVRHTRQLIQHGVLPKLSSWLKITPRVRAIG